MESGSNADLPFDVIHDILLRLPVKPLIRFKCVCKKWYALIGSPTFVNKYFSRKINSNCPFIRLTYLKRTTTLRPRMLNR